MSRVFEVLLPGLLSQPVQLLEVGLAVSVWLLLRRRPRWCAPLAAGWRAAAPKASSSIWNGG